jgi:tryptophan synthase alpha chain
MGYFNPIYNYGTEKFINKIISLGVDGIIIVDLPPEEDMEFCDMAHQKGLSFIRLATPTTDRARLSKIMQKTDGFLYYVSITGVTGSIKPDIGKVKDAIYAIKEETQIPICVGFGIKTTEDVKNIISFADGVIVGSALVNIIENKKSEASIKEGILNKVKDLASVL